MRIPVHSSPHSADATDGVVVLRIRWRNRCAPVESGSRAVLDALLRYAMDDHQSQNALLESPPPTASASGPRKRHMRTGNAPRLEHEWRQQWEMLDDVPEVPWLFEEWIAPNSLEVFRDRDVLEAGCGAGHQMAVVQPLARRLVGIDMSADCVARQRFAATPHVEVRRGDLLSYDTDERFDVVYSIGVLHHTDDPDEAFRNMARLVKPGGRMIVWVYSREGNGILRWLIEPFRKLCCRPLSRAALWKLSAVCTAMCYPLIYTLYRLPLRFLPYYDYFANARRLDFRRNVCNVFDKLNAPQTYPVSRAQIERWFDPGAFTDVHISPYVGVSWRASGTKR